MNAIHPTNRLVNWRNCGIWMAGIFVGNIALICLYLGVAALGKFGEKFQLFLGLPSLFLIPLFGGLVASYIWRILSPTISATVIFSLIMSAVSLAGAAILLREGVICLIIVCPLYFGIVLSGALLGRILFKSRSNRVQIAIFPLVALLAAVEIYTREDTTGVVTDTLLIHATPEKIWPELTAFPDIPTKPTFWLFRLGLPFPESTTTQGDFVGAKRECNFSGGAIFQETVVELEKDKTLTFDIIGLPQDPELIGHLTPHRGRFTLLDNGDGTTTLTGDTWYTLHVRPLGYFDWWTQHIFRAVHLRVMEDIRLRAEKL